jgi:hypothetical protein
MSTDTASRDGSVPENGITFTRRARSWRIAVLLGTLAIAVGWAILTTPIPQDLNYHNFADKRPVLSIPNFADVASNAAFAIVGLLAVVWLARNGRPPGLAGVFARTAFAVFFAGVFLTAFGSGYYHLNPSNQRLLWDRLPMTIGFMSLFAIVIAERIGTSTGIRLLIPLLLLGAVSAIYWYLGELHGHGDLRWYLLVQFYPIVAIPLLCLLFPPSYTRTTDLLLAVGLYIVAKAFEAADQAVFSLGNFVSGHTLKHLVSAAATLWLLRMFALRIPIQRSQPAA